MACWCTRKRTEASFSIRVHNDHCLGRIFVVVNPWYLFFCFRKPAVVELIDGENLLV
uniref:Uncharacterized protein n=1 Tax=Lepeophtheirus salmonis TaxID=72036 RepID=A0A0K2VHB1_LEPSM